MAGRGHLSPKLLLSRNYLHIKNIVAILDDVAGGDDFFTTLDKIRDGSATTLSNLRGLRVHGVVTKSRPSPPYNSKHLIDNHELWFKIECSYFMQVDNFDIVAKVKITPREPWHPVDLFQLSESINRSRTFTESLELRDHNSIALPHFFADALDDGLNEIISRLTKHHDNASGFDEVVGRIESL